MHSISKMSLEADVVVLGRRDEERVGDDGVCLGRLPPLPRVGLCCKQKHLHICHMQLHVEARAQQGLHVCTIYTDPVVQRWHHCIATAQPPVIVMLPQTSCSSLVVEHAGALHENGTTCGLQNT